MTSYYQFKIPISQVYSCNNNEDSDDKTIHNRTEVLKYNHEGETKKKGIRLVTLIYLQDQKEHDTMTVTNLKVGQCWKYCILVKGIPYRNQLIAECKPEF